MMVLNKTLLALLLSSLSGIASAFVISQGCRCLKPLGPATWVQPRARPMLLARKDDNDGEGRPLFPLHATAETALKSTLFALALSLASWIPSNTAIIPNAAAAVTDPGAIVGCLVQKCQLPFAKCITNPKCLANVICINTCNNKADETGCQIQCGDYFDNEVVGEFNKCAVSDMSCVPQKKDEGLYPEPIHEQMVPKFDTKFFNGKLYITAGLNPLFDIFPCQVHFFTETTSGRFYGKLNWNIVEPDGEFFTRDALQQFVQDPKEPAHLINHDNEYLHYKDDWYIIDCAYEGNSEGLPPFAYVYYRGSNDAWDGYGGAVIYTKDAKLPEVLIPRLREASKKIGRNWDDFVVTDNSCPRMEAGEALQLREKYVGDVFLQTEKQLQSQATRFRGNAANSVKAQKVFFSDQTKEAERAFEELKQKTLEFENNIISNEEKALEEFISNEAKEAEKTLEELKQKTLELEKSIISNEEKVVEELKEKTLEIEKTIASPK